MRTLAALLACLVLLPACDAVDSGESLDGYTGHADLLGAWRTSNGVDYAYFSYHADSRSTVLDYADRIGGPSGECFQTESATISSLTESSITYRAGAAPRSYAIDEGRLSVPHVDYGVVFVYEQTDESLDSLTPLCP